MDGSSGIFKVPESGRYLFGFKAKTAKTKDWARVQVYINDSHTISITEGNEADIWNSIGATWLFQLIKDSTVRLKVTHHKLNAQSILFWGFRISEV